MSRVRRILSILALIAVVAVPLAASAAPTCTTPGTEAACGGRVVAPALQSATFLQYGLEFASVLTEIEKVAPGIVDVDPIHELLGDPAMKSAGGRVLYVVRLTDEAVTTPKRQVAISLSIHANESAGREGGTRYIEDIARWWAAGDRNHKLYAGDTARPLRDILAQTEIYLAFLNPDGWASGDLGSPGTFNRGNQRGVDLNRQFPTIGWTKLNQLAEPEAQAWARLVGGMDRLTTATDIHGELNSASFSFSDIMYPAGQWDPRQQAQELQFAQNMQRTVERKFEEEGVVLQKIFDPAGSERPMKPADYATAYDIVNYDDSGFMGDWFVREGAVEVDVENFLSHTVPSNIWFGPLEQAHVAAVKGNIEATIVESMITHLVQADVPIGRVAYVMDPNRVSRNAGEGELAYSVSRMEYFAELASVAGVPVTPIAAEDVATADLSSFDSVVVADMTVPTGSTADPAAYGAALERFATAGGQVVLTDAALQLLPALGVQTTATRRTANGGDVTFGALDHQWEKDLAGLVGQTYYAVPLGYTATNQAANWTIPSTAVTAAGGTVVGTFNTGNTNLAQIPHGAGSIALFGAILPTQTQNNRHDYGLTDYAVTVTGGEVLNTMLEYRRP